MIAADQLHRAGRRLLSWREHDPVVDWLYVAACLALTLMAGLMSGLTLGLLSLDTVELEVLLRSGTPREQRAARKIMPLLANTHCLLVTLLLCNACAMEALPLFLDELADPVTAVIVSVTAVLLGGEIIPQAVCSRYGLAVGASLAPLVRSLMWVCSPVSWPVGKVLDFLLGPDHHTLFRRRQLKEFVSIHAEDAGMGGALTRDEIKVITGALDLTSKVAYRAMTPLDKVFMLSSTDRLDEATLRSVLHSGHSRIPVHRAGRRSDVVGLLLVKELLQYRLGSSEVVPVEMLRLRSIPRLPATTPMYDMLRLFQTGRSHIAVLTQPPPGELRRLGATEPSRSRSARSLHTAAAARGGGGSRRSYSRLRPSDTGVGSVVGGSGTVEFRSSADGGGGGDDSGVGVGGGGGGTGPGGEARAAASLLSGGGGGVDGAAVTDDCLSTAGETAAGGLSAAADADGYMTYGLYGNVSLPSPSPSPSPLPPVVVEAASSSGAADCRDSLAETLVVAERGVQEEVAESRGAAHGQAQALAREACEAAEGEGSAHSGNCAGLPSLAPPPQSSEQPLAQLVSPFAAEQPQQASLEAAAGTATAAALSEPGSTEPSPARPAAGAAAAAALAPPPSPCGRRRSRLGQQADTAVAAAAVAAADTPAPAESSPPNDADVYGNLRSVSAASAFLNADAATIAAGGGVSYGAASVYGDDEGDGGGGVAGNLDVGYADTVSVATAAVTEAGAADMEAEADEDGDGDGDGEPEEGTPIGIITLEDVIEELIRAEIVDETDRYVDNLRLVRANPALLAQALPEHLARVLGRTGGIAGGSAAGRRAALQRAMSGLGLAVGGGGGAAGGSSGTGMMSRRSFAAAVAAPSSYGGQVGSPRGSTYSIFGGRGEGQGAAQGANALSVPLLQDF